MTGFGRAVIENEHIKATCEIKALNGRYFEADIRLPKFLYEIDASIRRMLSEKLERGTITCIYNIKLVDEQNAAQEIQVNEILARKYLSALQSLSSSLNVELNDPFREIIKVPEVIGTADKEISEDIKNEIIQLTMAAADNLIKFREIEGVATGEKLMQLVQSISQDLIVVENEEDARKEALKERIYGNLREHIQENLIDQNRMEQEILIYLDKWDIAEEKQRLTQHVNYFIQSLKTEPKGRKLNFIAQEMGREMNTMGVKSNYFPMQQAVVQMKEKLEQIKEQVLNLA